MNSIKTILRLGLIIIFLISNSKFIMLYAQVGINSDGSNPDASAMLDVVSTDKGMLIPRMDSTSRLNISNPADGLILYDSTTMSFWYYDNETWNEIRNSQKNIQVSDIMEEVASSEDYSCFEQIVQLGVGAIGEQFREEMAIVSGNYLYLLFSTSLKIFDISDIHNITQVGYISSPSYKLFYDFKLSGNFIYTIDTQSDSMRIFDVSDPTNPFQTSAIYVGVAPEDLVVDNQKAYVLSFTDDSYTSINFDIYDVSDPYNISLVASPNLGSSEYDVEGDYIYYEFGGNLRVADVSDPNNVTIYYSGLTANSNHDRITVMGNYLYGWTATKFYIYDISDISNIILLSQTSIAQVPILVTDGRISGNFFYTVSFNSNQLEIYDITDPTSVSFHNSIELDSKYRSAINLDEAGKFIFTIHHYTGGGDSTILTVYARECNSILGYNTYTNELVNITSNDIDDQTIDKFELSGTTLSLSLENDGEDDVTVDLSSYLDNTDNQELSLSTNTLSLSGGSNTIDLSNYLDNTDHQELSISTNTLSLSGGSNTIDLSSYLDNTDHQELSLSTNTLSLSGGSNTINLSGYLDNTDNQALSFSGSNLSISGSSSTIDLSSLSDDLGNHTATTTISLDDNWLNNDGVSGKGIRISDDGRVGINAGNFSTHDLFVLGTSLFQGSITASSNLSVLGNLTINGTTELGDNINTNNYWISGDGDNEGIYIATDGSVGIGTNLPDSHFDVSDAVSGTENYVAVVQNTQNNNSSRNDVMLVQGGHNSYTSSHQSSFILFARPDGTYCGRIAQDGSTSVDYRQASDRRLKENIESTNYGLADLMKIQVVDYDFIGDESDKPHTGFIAQELHTAFPPAVTVGGENPKKNPWEVSYGSVVPLVVKAVQEQEKAIEDLRIENEKLKKSNEALKAQVNQINALKAQLEQIQGQLNSSISE